MKVLIEIPEKVYKKAVDGMLDEIDSCYLNGAVVNGTPLPKGHEALVDENQVIAALVHSNFLKDDVKCGDITRILDRATIIKADKKNESEAK